MVSGNPFQPAKRSVQSGGKTSIFSAADKELATVNQSERIIHVNTGLLVPFHDHPFKVLDDDAMASLMASIEHDGIRSPLLVRKLSDGAHYEILSGHRRHHAAELLGLDTVPVIVLDVDDDTATIVMVDANLNRPSLLISEQAKSMKQRYDALKHQGVRLGDVALTTAEKLAQKYQKSQVGIRRLVQLGSLPDSILDLVDARRLSAASARNLRTMSPQDLDTLTRFMDHNPHVRLKPYMVAVLKNRPHEITETFLAELVDIRKPVSPRTPVKSEEIEVRIPVSIFPSFVRTDSERRQYVLRAVSAAAKHHQKGQH
ncbi:ParB/RepB/Spo0J family partition protein [Alloscardovia criceti]|uniref:ParB/RepB/Spo0J family partition protein n=1 Tax=Alloscardovia criceti TaxID=356828 RepID=UPI000377B064|nr:ParB/RepB/Spo0J family partition protein [Alloscardovia criceti]